MNPDAPQSPRDELEARLTALLLGELTADEAAALRETFAHDAELSRLHDRLKLALELVRETALAPESEAQAKPEPVTLAPERLETLLKLFKKPAPKPITHISTWRAHRREWLQLAAMLVALLTTTGVMTLAVSRRERASVDIAVGFSSLEKEVALYDRAGSASAPDEYYATPMAMSERAGETAQPKSGSGPESSKSLEFSQANFSAAEAPGTVTLSVVPPAQQQTEFTATRKVVVKPQAQQQTAKSDVSHFAPAKKAKSSSLAAAAPEAAAPASEAMPKVLNGGNFTTVNGETRNGITRINGSKSGPEIFSVDAVGFANVNAPAGRPAIQDQERSEGALRNSTTIALPITVDDLAVVTDESLAESPRGATVAAGKPAIQTQGGSGVSNYRSLGSVQANMPKDALPALEKQLADQNGVADAFGDRFGTFAGQGGGGGMGGGVAGGGRKANSAPAGAKDMAELSDNFRFADGRVETLKREAQPQVPSGPAPKAAKALGVQNESEVKQKAEASGVGPAAALEEVRRSQMGMGRSANPQPKSEKSIPQVRAGLELDNKESGRSLVRESLKDGEAKGDRVSGLAAPVASAAPAEPLSQAAVAFGIEPQKESKAITDFVADATVVLGKELSKNKLAAAPRRSLHVKPESLTKLTVNEQFFDAVPIRGSRVAGIVIGSGAGKPENLKGTKDSSAFLGQLKPADRKPVYQNFGDVDASEVTRSYAWQTEPPQGGLWDVRMRDALPPPLGATPLSLSFSADNASGTERAKERLTTFQRSEGLAAGAELYAFKLDGVAQDFASTEAKQHSLFFEQNQITDGDALPAVRFKTEVAQVPAQGLGLKVPERGLSDSSVALNFDSGLKVKGVTALPRSDTVQLDRVVELEVMELPDPSEGRNDKFYKIELPALGDSDNKTESAVTARGRLGRLNAVQTGSEPVARKELAQLANEDSKKVSAESERKVVAAEKAVAETRKSAEVEQRLKQVETAWKTPAKPAAVAPIPQSEVSVAENAFSTFSLNVSDVSFKLAAASLEKGLMPEVSTLRSEEFINAFDYHDPEPTGNAPVTFAWERARYPFAQDRDLLRFSVKTAASGRQPGRPLNLVLLLDNSGSMERADRVLIRQECLRVLASQLQPEDRVSVVAFARTARLWVDGLPGTKAGELSQRVGALTPEGGTNLEEAMNLAYQTAKRHFIPKGMNRVVLLTDGAANLGDVQPESLKQKVEAQRKQGVALDCFGIGWDGYNDELLEILSRNGDGRYGFVNTPEAATSEFAAQLAGALNVAASDVKVQVEWNPSRVTAFRQIGYAKHQLKKEQFRDNTVDAAELAAAESGNALYTVQVNPRGEGPLGTVRVRFKVPGTDDYREHEWAVPYQGEAKPLEQSSNALRLAATAAAFSEWLAVSPFAAEVTADQLLGYLAGVPEVFPADPRPKQLEWMIRQVKSLMGGK